MDLRDGLDDLENRKFLTLVTRTPTPTVVQPVASRYTDYATRAPIRRRENNIKIDLRSTDYEVHLI
jgi:hypothetical protein